MALLITKPITVLGAIETNELYLRFNYKVDMAGSNVQVKTSCYLNKEAYKKNYEITVNDISKFDFFKYNRQSDGEDILNFIHEKVKTDLTTDKFEKVRLKDPSTGQYMIDEETGLFIEEDVLIQEKFAEPNQVQIIGL